VTASAQGVARDVLLEELRGMLGEALGDARERERALFTQLAAQPDTTDVEDANHDRP